MTSSACRRHGPGVLLGVCDSQDSGAALFVDGRLRAAVNEERLNRRKLWGGFPVQSIREVLRIAGVAPRQVDAVALGSHMTPAAIWRCFRATANKLRRRNQQFGYGLNLNILHHLAARRVPGWQRTEGWVSARLVAHDLARLGICAPVRPVDHHECHAYTAFAASGWESALVVTMDGLGDGLAVTVSVGRPDGRVQRVFAQSASSVSTLFYSRITEWLGFTPIKDEGKVMALAAHGDPTPARPLADALLWLDNDRFGSTNHWRPASPTRGIYQQLARYRPEDVAAAWQAALEERVSTFVRVWAARMGERKVALAGGVFANVKLNQCLLDLPEVDDAYIFPHMGDGGLAVGAVYALTPQSDRRLDSMFLGPEYDDRACEEALSATGLKISRHADMALTVARLLAAGRVVARFTGRMEYGPRSLGHRSVFYRPNDPATLEKLNARLRRTDFMPFAPAVRDVKFSRCFEGAGSGTFASEFMTLSYDSRPGFASDCPGVVHVDGSVRPQRVREGTNPELYQVLSHFEDITGLPAILNTSFNLHDEPIVCRPEEAIRAFQTSGIDYLALGPWLVESSHTRRRAENTQTIAQAETSA